MSDESVLVEEPEIQESNVEEDLLIEEPYLDMEEVQVDRGWYSIHLFKDNNLSVDVSAMSEKSGGNIQIYKYNNSLAQRFFITQKVNGWYTIQNVCSKKQVGITSESVGNGTNILQWEEKNDISQEFKFYRDSDGGLVIYSHAGENLVCDVKSGKLASGSNLQLYTYNGTNAQKFLLKKCEFPGEETEVQEGVYRIYPSSAPDVSMDVAGGSVNAGGNIQLYTENGTAAQEWKIVKQGQWYRILSGKSNMTLDVKSGSTSAGANLQQWTANTGNGQLYRFYKTGENEYCIMSKVGTAIDCKSGVFTKGTNLHMYHVNGTKAQKWGMEKIIVPSCTEKIVDEGYYTLSPGSSLTSFMAIENANVEAGANIGVTEKTVSDEHVFKLEKQSDGWYMLKNLESGKYLNVTSGSKECGANLQQYNKNGSAAQKFKFYATEEGHYYIKSQLLTFIEVDHQNNGNVQMNEVLGEAHQKWKLSKVLPEKSEVSVADGDYNILSGLGNNLVMDIKSGSKASGGNVQVYTNNESWAQNYYICKQADGWYTIKNNGSGLYLDIAGGNANPGANLQQYTGNGTDAQRFKFYDAGGGKIIIKSKKGTVIDVSGGIKKPGTNVKMYSFNGSDAQKWSLKKADVLSKIQVIKTYKGTRYVSGGASPSGWDCSGFTQWALKYLGVSIPRTSAQQAKGGKAISMGNMSLWKPGDLLIYASGGSINHVALYLGNGQLMHALSSKYGTIIQDVYYYEKWDKKNTLVAVRRYL